MFDKALKYSYAAQRYERHKLLRFFISLLILYLLYNTIITLFFSVWIVRNDSMQPGVRSGDRLLAASTALPSFIAAIKTADEAVPFKRGSLIVLDTRRREEKQNWFLVVTDNLVRFFTAQRAAILKTEERLYIKRLIALPGDQISMTHFVLQVRPAGSAYTLTEFELSERPYHPHIPQMPALWDATLPFSGSMDTRVLGPGEYFVVSDDRSNTGDSRTWGPVSAQEIIGRPVFRFWPLARIGRP